MTQIVGATWPFFLWAKRRWAEPFGPTQPNPFCFVFCLGDHYNVTDTSLDGGFSKRLAVATWPPRRAGMWDTSGFICSQPLTHDPVTNIRALLCLNKHPEHWNRAWRNKTVFKGWYPTQQWDPAQIQCLISKWVASLKNYTLTGGHGTFHVSLWAEEINSWSAMLHVMISFIWESEGEEHKRSEGLCQSGKHWPQTAFRF